MQPSHQCRRHLLTRRLLARRLLPVSVMSTIPPTPGSEALTSVAPHEYSTLQSMPRSAKYLLRESEPSEWHGRAGEARHAAQRGTQQLGLCAAHFLVVLTSSEAMMVPARPAADWTGLFSGTASTHRAGLDVALLYCSSHTSTTSAPFSTIQS